MALVAFPLLALEFTHNSILIAGVAVAGRLPAVLVELPAGALVDRHNRRRLIVAVELLRLAVLGGFAAAVWSGADGLAAIYVTVFALGALESAYSSASTASLPAMVPRRSLVRANSKLLTLNVGGQELVGQALGGLALSAAPALPFAADAASFAASALLLRKSIPDTPPTTARTSLGADLREGLQWFFGSPLLRSLASLIASMAFFQAAVLGILVLYGTEDLHLSKTGYGLLLAVPSLGNIAGALSATPLDRRLGSGWTLIVTGSAAALAYPVLAWTSSSVVAAAALTLEALCVVLGNVLTRSIRQAMVPMDLQGRVAGAYRIFILAAMPLGGLIGGFVASQVGIRTTFLLAGLMQIMTLVLVGPRLLARLGKTSEEPEVFAAGSSGSGPDPSAPQQPAI